MAGLASLATLRLKVNQHTSDVLITEIDDAGELLLGFETRFQYFPETVTDSKAINYQKKEIPGGSLPIYQWVNSGERIISFSAVFTSDTNLIESDGRLRRNLVDRQDSTGVGSRNIDIRSALAWLRRFTLPTYETGGSDVGVPLSKAPPRLLLSMPNSGIGVSGGTDFDGFYKDAIRAIKTQCDVTYEAFYPSGLPRIATVQLSFAQIAQNAGKVDFPRRATFEKPATIERAVLGTLGAFKGYQLRDKSKES